jgi:CheY-like chemotaxis protein
MPVNQCIEASMDDHLPKPLVAADLFTLIEKCCVAVDRPNSTTVSTSKK